MRHFLIAIILLLSLGACGDTGDSTRAKFDRIVNILNGEDKHKTAYLLTQQVVNLQKLVLLNNELRLQLSGMWRGEIEAAGKLKTINDNARNILAIVSKGIDDKSVKPKLDAYNKVLPTLQPHWNKMLKTAALTIDNSKQLGKLRNLLEALQSNAHNYSASVNEYISQIVGLKSSRENTMVLYYLSYILSKSMDIEQRIKFLLATNILDTKPLKHIMRAQNNIRRILKGMFRGDPRANIKILTNKKRRKIVQNLTNQFTQLNFLQLEDAYEKLRENNYSLDDQQIDFDETAKVTDSAIQTLTMVMNE